MGEGKEVLAIATGHVLSVALFRGEELLGEGKRAEKRGYAEKLVPMVRALLGARRPQAIMVEVGPGSFTGLRVGIAAARALALAWRLPLQGMRSTLMVAAAARARGEKDGLQIALAAPRGQTWCERFCAGSLESVAPPFVVPAGKEPAAFGTTIAARPWAADGRFIPAGYLQSATPLYVREEAGHVAR